MIARIGQALYGQGYHAKLADALGVRARLLRRWETGETPVPDKAWIMCAALFEERDGEWAELRREIADKIAAAQRGAAE